MFSGQRRFTLKPKVSVVVPIYRVEKYLSACIDSLLAQTLQEIEIILVDDGSPDSCGTIADAYAQKDPRVKVIHQRNEGLGPARNRGLGVASGAYVGFVDSDDWVRPEMYQHLYDTAVEQGADIVVSGYCCVSGGRVVTTKPHPLGGRTLDSAEEICKVRKNLYGHTPWDQDVEAFPMSVCMSIYRNEMIRNRQLSFQNVLSEDTIFNLDAYRWAEVISFTKDTDYCYRKENQGSITTSYSEKKLLQFQHFLTLLAEMAAEEGDEECALRAKRMAIDYCRMYVGIVEGSGMTIGDKKAAVGLLAENKEIQACMEGYPVATLPVQQRVFHKMLTNGNYGMVFALNRIRQWLKRIGLRQ